MNDKMDDRMSKSPDITEQGPHLNQEQRIEFLERRIREFEETVKILERGNRATIAQLEVEKKCTDLLRGMLMEILHRRIE
jgi:hypothetical protein